MEISGQHFTEDPEALEAFVLGRSDPASRARYEEHLGTCETCRQAVHTERIIAAGIKRAGRERQKERIGMLLGMPPSRHIPWPQVLSVAAVLALLVGIGITQRWFVTHVAPKDIATLESLPQNQKSVSVTPETRNEQTTSPQVAPRADQPVQRYRDSERATMPEESKTKGRTGETELGAQASADRLEEAPALAGGSQKEFWASGTVITENPSKKQPDEGQAASSGMTRRTQAAKAFAMKADAIGHVSVEQRPASTLPARLQSQQLYSLQTIQTLVRQTQSETQLTLYPVSPFDSTQLHHARVQQITADSIVVQIGPQQIGYRLPAGAMRQGQMDSTELAK